MPSDTKVQAFRTGALYRRNAELERRYAARIDIGHTMCAEAGHTMCAGAISATTSAGNRQEWLPAYAV
jgi:hypothetical protein